LATGLGICSELSFEEAIDMAREELPPHKRALFDRIEQICNLLDSKDRTALGEEYERLMGLLQKFIVELQAKD
jgi:hypothetical protein